MIQVSEFECTGRTAVGLGSKPNVLDIPYKNLAPSHVLCATKALNVSFRCLKVCNNMFRTLKYKEFTAYF